MPRERGEPPHGTMTTIDFYTHCADRYEVASRLVAKAWALHGAVRVLTDGAHATGEFGRFLWQWPATGFFPHCQLASPLAAETPIVVDHALDHDGPAAVLINLHASRRRSFRGSSGLPRSSAATTADLASGRERWKFYKARGYEIRSYDSGRADGGSSSRCSLPPGGSQRPSGGRAGARWLRVNFSSRRTR